MAEMQEIFKNFFDHLAKSEARQQQQMDKQQQQMDKQHQQMDMLLKLVGEQKLSSESATTTTEISMSAVPASAVPMFHSYQASTELFDDYESRFSCYAKAQAIPENRLAQIFLTNQSAEIYQLINVWAKQQSPPKEIHDLDYNEITGFLGEHFNPKRFVLRERYQYWTGAKRLPSETIPELVARIRKEANTCNFDQIINSLDEALRMRFFCTVNNEAVLAALFRIPEDQLTFDKAAETALQVEEASKAIRETVTRDQGLSVLGKIQKKPSENNKPCHRCGKLGHNPDKCFHKDAKCRHCKKKGHIETVCLSKKKQTMPRKNFKSTSIVADIKGRNPAIQRVVINNQSFNFEIDSGAEENFCSTKFWEKLGRPKLVAHNQVFKSVTGNKIPISGSFQIEVQIPDTNVKEKLKFNVSSIDHLNLIGRTGIIALEINVFSLLKRIQMERQHSNPDEAQQSLKKKCNDLCNEFQELFSPELGCLTNVELEIQFKTEVKPVFCRPRPVPYAIQDVLNQILDEGIKSKLWIPTVFNDYGTPIVPIKKKEVKGQQEKHWRICGDYSVTVNSQLETNRYPLPSPDDLVRKLRGNFFFSKIDLANAYSQIKLGPESQKRLALSTHKGILLQTRLPFGISSAPGYFQQIMDKLTQDLKGVAVYLDDILVSGETLEEHVANLKALLQRLHENGLRCNRNKCVFAQNEVEYLGHRLTRQGLKKGCKADAVANMPPPKDIPSLRSFLGSVQFYAKFIPNLAYLTEPLTRLTRKEIEWNWGAEQQSAFLRLKETLGAETILMHFDPSRPVGISTDASEIGIGAVLFHRFPDGSERPIVNVSKTLTQTQRRYSQIQKEALAILFGIKKFHQFVYGRKFILVTDHKPLLSIFNPSKNTPVSTANRLARWALTLNQYDYQIEYRKTTEHGNADALSRLPCGEDREFDSEQDETKCSEVCTIKMINKQLDSHKVDLIAKESEKDPLLSKVMHFCEEGWPLKEMPVEIQQYKKLADSLHTEDKCLFLGYRAVIPTSLRKKVLELLHVGHFGIQRMKQLARSVVYWPGINSDIEQLARSCEACAGYRNDPPKVANHPWIFPEKPWSRVHIDHAVNFQGKNWLVVTDAYSRYPCIHITGSMTARTTIDLLEVDFAHFGYPHMLVTDNAPTFLSAEFQEWCKDRGIKHWSGAPYHPATNGSAERLIQTLKQSLRKSKLPIHHALQEFLLQYRRTPLDSGFSPSELLNGRQIRSRIDTILPSPRYLRANRNKGTSSPHNNKDRLTSNFQLGKECLARVEGPQKGNLKWVPATIVKTQGERTFWVKVKPTGHVWKRHIEQLLPQPEREAPDLPWTPHAPERRQTSRPPTEVSEILSHQQSTATSSQDDSLAREPPTPVEEQTTRLSLESTPPSSPVEHRFQMRRPRGRPPKGEQPLTREPPATPRRSERIRQQLSRASDYLASK